MELSFFSRAYINEDLKIAMIVIEMFIISIKKFTKFFQAIPRDYAGGDLRIQNCYNLNGIHDCIWGNQLKPVLSVNGVNHTIDHFEILTNPFNLAYKWVKSSSGNIPLDAVKCGKEMDKEYYCGRAYVTGRSKSRGLVPVKIRESIAYGWFYYGGGRFQTSNNT